MAETDHSDVRDGLMAELRDLVNSMAQESEVVADPEMLNLAQEACDAIEERDRESEKQQRAEQASP